MELLFIGLGSIAKRHIKNIRELPYEKVVISVLRSGYGQDISEEYSRLINHILTSDEMLGNHYDAVFITNPTSMHYDTLKKYNELSDAFFIEKPVFFLEDKKDISIFDPNKKYYVAAPLRYCNVIQWLKNNINFSTVHSIRVISSSYLPEWRQGTDYRKSYSAQKVLGGGVSIDLIHEWDYINYLIGLPLHIKSIICKKSQLEIDSDDLAVYIAEYSDKVVELHLDYFGRCTQRKIELYGEDDTIIADLVSQKITWLNSGKEINLFEERDSFQKKEIVHFFEIVKGSLDSDNTLQEACEVLNISRGEL